MQEIESLLKIFQEYAGRTLFTIGDSRITLIRLFLSLSLVVLVFIFSRWIRRILSQKILTKTKLDLGMRESISTITQYIVLVLGLVIALQSIGIDLTALHVLAGALGVGIGFGLQTIANNFISGLIIMFQRPIKLGDRIQVDDVSGKVVQIGSRGTTVLTNDNIAIIVPNSDFMTKNVINWSYGDEKVRFRIPIGVSYDSDIDLVDKVLLQIADEHPGVMKQPAPKVCFRSFGDSSLNFELWVWTEEYVQRKGYFVSTINYSILKGFRENNIEIPFPQRVLHQAENLER